MSPERSHIMVPVKWPKCNGDVSSEADKCPHIGEPLPVFIEKSLVYQSKWGLRIIFLGLAIAFLLLSLRFCQVQLGR